MSRDQMIADTMKAGLSRADAAVLTDVSKHAFEDGMRAVQRIIETCPPDLRFATFASVLASFATILREHFPEHWIALVAAPMDHAGDGSVIILPDKRQNGEVG